MTRQHVLVVTAARPLPPSVRQHLREDGHYVFESGFENIESMLRTVFVDVIVVVGEVTEAWQSALGEVLSQKLLARTTFVERLECVPAAVAAVGART